MLSKAEQGETIPAHEVQSSTAYEKPIQPIELLKWVFEQLSAIPWVACGAMGTGAGIALLYFYFASIDFVPPDIPSILSASLLMALLAFALYMWVVVCLVAPLAAYQAMGLEARNEKHGKSKKQWLVSGLWALQFIGVSGLLLFIGIPMWRKCVPLSGYFLALGVAFALLGLIGWIQHELKAVDHRHAWKKRLGSALLVCGVATLPFIALLQLLILNRGADWPHLGAFFAVWLFVVAGSALLNRIPVWGCALLLTCLSPILVYSVPGLLGHPAFFPTKVAELAGIRAERTAELRVPRSTCDLIQSALGASQTVKPVTCVGVEWGIVHAQVLSNLGDRWLIELKLADAQPLGRNGALRLTIPGEGVQTLQLIVAPTTSAGCPT
jgi:hypothetical protein